MFQNTSHDGGEVFPSLSRGFLGYYSVVIWQDTVSEELAHSIFTLKMEAAESSSP
jgi:hypothetical protein